LFHSAPDPRWSAVDTSSIDALSVALELNGNFRSSVLNGAQKAAPPELTSAVGATRTTASANVTGCVRMRRRSSPTGIAGRAVEKLPAAFVIAVLTLMP
jgi:hypothetical protein